MEITSRFEEYFGRTPLLRAQAPGRVNLLGEHVDYNDGVVLPVTIDRVVQLAAAPTEDGTVTLVALDIEDEETSGPSVCAFSLDTLEERIDVKGEGLPEWILYPAGVAWSLHEAGVAVSGMQAVYTSDIPIGSGLSSSAAIEVVFAVTWGALGGWEADCMQIAQWCQRAENKYVGVASGLMDQFASACGLEGHALYFDTRNLEWRPVTLPPGVVIVIADSGVRRDLTHSAYNERRASCEEAVEALRQYRPELQSLRDISSVEFMAYSLFLPEVPRMRAEHVVKEMYRVEQAVNALRGDDMDLFGGLMFAGHASLRDLYEVSIPELDTLVEVAREQPGIYGARLTGAGFGGCTVNLVDESQSEAFILGLERGYRERTGLDTQVYLCHASQGAKIDWL
jgi:galactokinase